jgi:prolyl oligopeptidase
MFWVAVAFAGKSVEPDDPWRWLEHERSPEVEAWWKERTEESRAWLAAQGRQEAIAAWLRAVRVRPRHATMHVDHLDDVSLWSRAEFVVGDPPPRWIYHLYLQRPGEPWPGTELPLEPNVDRCAAVLLEGGRVLLGSSPPRTGDEDQDELHPCTLTVDAPDGGRRALGTFDQPSLVRSPDGAALLVSHRRSAHRTSLSTVLLATGETDEVFRTRRALDPWAWRDETVLATSFRRTGEFRPRSLWILRGPTDDLDWLGSGPFRPWFGRNAELAALRDDELLLRTDDFGVGGNVVRVDPEHPRWWSWRVRTGERPGMDLVQARVHGDALLTVWSRDGLQILEEEPYDGGASHVVDLGGPASRISIWRTLTPTAVVTVSTPVGLRYELRSTDGTYTVLHEDTTVDATFRSVSVPSADGTEIPVTLVVPNTAPPPGGRPVLLDVYGGFGISEDPNEVGPLERCWLAAGGALGTVHARGGHERGDAWHEAALTTEHPRTYEDLIAAARGLVDQGIAAPGRVAVTGASNGGLTVAAAVARDPGAFGAVYATAGVYDLLRANRFGRWWPKEYGRTKNPDELEVLRAESPVHKLPAGPLPPIWLSTGERDNVVAPAHSYKLAAAWADAAGGPVLLDVDPWGTHHGRETVDRDLRKKAELDWTIRTDASAAEMLGFLFAVFDLDVPPTPE